MVLMAFSMDPGLRRDDIVGERVRGAKTEVPAFAGMTPWMDDAVNSKKLVLAR
ncbi:hypothetical protein N8D56_24300 [Devosia sp. A8/3-2]|nr:hypothetical protein N8D56_24300 [Devosia sp. A8/3-2]